MSFFKINALHLRSFESFNLRRALTSSFQGANLKQIHYVAAVGKSDKKLLRRDKFDIRNVKLLRLKKSFSILLGIDKKREMINQICKWYDMAT